MTTPRHGTEGPDGLTAEEACLRWVELTEDVKDPTGNTIRDELRTNFIPRIREEAVAAHVRETGCEGLTEALDHAPNAAWEAAYREFRIMGEPEARAMARADVVRIEVENRIEARIKASAALATAREEAPK